MKFSIKGICKCEQVSSFLTICSHLLKKSLMENFNFLWSVRFTSILINICLEVLLLILLLIFADWFVDYSSDNFSYFITILEMKAQ